MAADSMFYQPSTILMKPVSENKVATNRLVLGIVGKQETKAYPIRFIGKTSKAYDWNRLVKERIIYDAIGNKPIMLVIGKNNQSFFAFERNTADEKYALQQDSLSGLVHKYLINGRSIDSTAHLKSIPAYQEFWHSWKTFHPATLQY